MSVLTLRCVAPFQAWSCNGNFGNRTVSDKPTKSGIVGMIAGAMGRVRGSDVSDLVGLVMGVRIDKPSVSTLIDYQSATGVKKDENWIACKHYLQDATFTVYLAHDDKAFLEEIVNALTHPVFPVYFGRRVCIPTRPIVMGITDADIQEVMKTTPCQARNATEPMELYLEGDVEKNDIRAIYIDQDLPLNTGKDTRLFGSRKYYQLDSVPV